MYIAVTNDQYEYPICARETLECLAEAMGEAAQKIWNQAWGKEVPGVKDHYKYVASNSLTAMYTSITEMEAAEECTYQEMVDDGVVFTAGGKYFVNWGMNATEEALSVLYTYIERNCRISMSCTSSDTSTEWWNMDSDRTGCWMVQLAKNEHGVFCVPVEIEWKKW